MIEWLAGWLVGQPQHILTVAAAHAALWLAAESTRSSATRRANALWVAALAWLAYAGWEWLVLVRSPDANIRVDLLLIWPVVGLATLWAWIRTALGWWRASAARRRR